MPPQQPRQSGTGAWKVLAGIAVLAAILSVTLWATGTGGGTKQAAPSTTTITPIPSTTTVTTTTTTTRTTERDTSSTERTTQGSDSGSQPQMPTPPNQAPAGWEWGLLGPYSSTWTCDQAAQSWPSQRSECFTYDGDAYYYGLRRPA